MNSYKILSKLKSAKVYLTTLGVKVTNMVTIFCLMYTVDLKFI